MSANNEYKRYFIILQEDDKGYEISPGKIPTGYLKIEAKNGRVKLNAFIQNVKVEDMAEYRLILVAPGRKLGVDVGKIIIDTSGRGELYYELESDNVLKSGVNISEFLVAAVTSGVSIPLSGYSGRDKIEWKGKYEVVNRAKAAETPRIDKKKIQIEEIVPPPPPLPPTVKPLVEPEPETKPMPEMKPEPEMKSAHMAAPEPMAKEQPAVENPVINKPIMNEPIMNKPIMNEPVVAPNPMPKQEPNINIEPINVPKPENVNKAPEKEIPMEMPKAMKCPPIAPMEEPCEVKEENPPYKPESQYYYYEEDDEEEKCEHHEHKHHSDGKPESYFTCPYYKSGMYNRMRKAIRRLRRYEPFEDGEKYEWFKIGDDIYLLNSVAIPYMGYMVPMGYPFMLEGYGMMMDRKDFILGVKYDEDEEKNDDEKKLISHIMFGISAVYTKRNEAYYKSRGFMTFRPHKSRAHGYFIMCIDLRSGMFCHLS